MKDTNPSATAPTPTTDVLVMGGGLAGLTLALQLRRRLPALRILVLERKQHPVPIAAHKVGESTVEIGAHYLAEVVGLRDHLDTAHLRKFGFRFFFSDGRHDVDQCTELGASRYLSVPTYQIDRGILENHLGHAVRAEGISFVDGARIHQVTLDAAQGHAVAWTDAQGQAQTTTARWVVDACGRAGMLKKKLALEQTNDHAAHAVWFRVNHRIDVDAWSTDPAWQARVTAPERWLSTNHLCGKGYWLWLIPLSSGSHSVGIVADSSLQPLEGMNTFDRAMDWIAEHQPRLHEALDPVRHTLQDFAFFKRFSYGSKQTFSDQRWALTGEAGRFLDPFYSPGSDMIGIGNTYITHLIAEDMAGRDIRGQARIFDTTFRTFYDSMLPLYQGQYALFGDAAVMPKKVIWDYTYYWNVLAPLFFHGSLTDVALLAQAQGDLSACRQLNDSMQAWFREASLQSPLRNDAPSPPRMFDQCSMDWFAELNHQLTLPKDATAVRKTLADGVGLLQRLAHVLQSSGPQPWWSGLQALSREAPPQVAGTMAA